MAVISGDIVPADEWDEKPNDGYRSRGNRYSADTIAEAIRARALGFSLQQISDRLGPNIETIRIWCQEAARGRQYPTPQSLNRVRGEMVVELEAMQHEALRVARMYPGTELALKGLTVANHILRTRANLIGVNAPQRVDVKVEEITEADRELFDMINEAKAKSALAEDKIKEGFERRQP